MVKVHTTITIDPDILERAKALRLNISGEIEEFLRNKVELESGNIAGLNVRLETIKLDRAIKNKNKYDREVKLIQDKLDKYKELITRQEEERLKAEKEKAEALTKCVNCGSFFGDKKAHSFPKGSVCNSCYLSASGEDVKNWNKGE